MCAVFAILLGFMNISLSPIPSVDCKPRKMITESGKKNLENSKMGRVAGRKAGNPALKIKGDLCSGVLSHPSSDTLLQSHHVETTTALRQADSSISAKSVYGSCN